MLMEVIKEQNYLRGALDQVNERFSSLDARIDSLESRIVSVENRMISLEERMISLEACVSEVQSRLSRKIRDSFRWLIGLMIPVWFGILVAIIVELVKG
jgi:predicted  nucleic acid-binding Zn-ribbon protein